ncbi:Kinase family protein [Melia azedarach]|nr:Kinase family protein [Melia azedarach]
MDSPSAAIPDSGSGSNDETPRVKFLCSFLGSILPRPQDGKLRYVGGETRIVSLPRDVTYEELMSRMRELYDGAVVLKYQQPDEDLDALVSVVNDDDVTNMMEEYEKLGLGDGFTRLRIFLFSHPDQDGSSHYVDGDDRETERRYVDALNNMNDGNDFRKLQQPDSPGIGSVDDMHMADRFFNTMSLEGGTHNQPQYNVHHLTIPHMGSGQQQPPVSQRYNEMENPWSPAFYSPRHYGHHDHRTVPDFPSSPSSARFRMPFGEERIPEEYSRQHVNHHSPYEHQQQFSDNLAWMQSGAVAGDKAGFPGNLLHGHNVFDGNGICEHCRVTFHRNQLHLEQPNMGNGIPQVPISCAECRPNRENVMLNAEAKLPHAMYPKDQSETRPVYNESHSHERGWMLQPQLNPRTEEARTHISGTGRLNDHYLVDGPSMNIPPGHGNLVDGHHMPPNLVHHRAGAEVGNELFHDPAVAATSHLHIASPEERVVRYGNYPYGADNMYPVSHGHVPAQNLWRNVQNPMHGVPTYEGSGSLINGSINPAFLRGAVEGNLRFGVGVDNQNSWVESSQRVPGFEGAATPPEYYYGQAQRLNPQSHNQENQCADPPQPSDSSSVLIRNKMVSSTTSGPELRNNNANEAVRMDENCNPGQEKEANHVEKVENSDVLSKPLPEQNMISEKSVGSNGLQTAEVSADNVKPSENGPCAPAENSKLSVNRLSFLPELLASVKRAALEEAKEVQDKVDKNTDSIKPDTNAKETPANESELANIHGELEADSDNDNVDTSKIEPTKAEAEAIARGLQTIKNDDLEEIRELGSGTYGSVYHGKWKGSDVAIKRIKASCFAGRPSERERLIADFWKEALLLSSLHHPNVVSFYGIVRDGPDGSLATVTEFMVNGSLKQFLQKKDRTIDRRKRLIIAMDAAFGMEYLHGKNIVHFDLKCENLLVNMRDPQRPVCKIGDLGLSKVKQHTLVSGGVRGTLPWMAPELLSGKSHMVTEKIDVYSFGIVMWELLTGDEPYTDMHCASIIGGIVNNTLRPQIPSWCDPEWKSLMESCWASDPAGRPSFSEISQRLRSMAAAINVK